MPPLQFVRIAAAASAYCSRCLKGNLSKSLSIYFPLWIRPLLHLGGKLIVLRGECLDRCIAEPDFLNSFVCGIYQFKPPCLASKARQDNIITEPWSYDYTPAFTHYSWHYKHVHQPTLNKDLLRFCHFHIKTIAIDIYCS